MSRAVLQRPPFPTCVRPQYEEAIRRSRDKIPERQATGGMPRDCADQMSDGDLAVECEQLPGGLLNSYYRKAA